MGFGNHLRQNWKLMAALTMVVTCAGVVTVTTLEAKRHPEKFRQTLEKEKEDFRKIISSGPQRS
eukprot:scaffold6925_cov248-Ochromonas_danica.AAC.6